MSNFREGLNALREISDPEKMKMALERITGKKLADYEGIDALVASLMGYYNDEVKKKLNKGAYVGDAQSLKDEVDGKISKAGDTVTGSLRIKNVIDSVIFDVTELKKGSIGYSSDHIFINNATSNIDISIYDNGNVKIGARNLATPEKEVISSINNIYTKGLIYKSTLNNKSKDFFDTLTETGIYDISDCTVLDGAYKWGTLIVYSIGYSIVQHYITDNAGTSTYTRTKYNSNWKGWHVIGGRYQEVATLTNVNDVYSYSGKEAFKLAIYVIGDGANNNVHSYYEFDNINIGTFNGIIPWNNQHDPAQGIIYEIKLQIDNINKQIKLLDRGTAQDGIAKIFLI